MIGKVKNPAAMAPQFHSGSDGLHGKAGKPIDSMDATSPTERVELSSRSKEIGRIRLILAGTPDIREDKIMALRRQIENGSYTVRSEAIVARMMGEALMDMEMKASGKESRT